MEFLEELVVKRWLGTETSHPMLLAVLEWDFNLMSLECVYVTWLGTDRGAGVCEHRAQTVYNPQLGCRHSSCPPQPLGDGSSFTKLRQSIEVASLRRDMKNDFLIRKF